MAETENEARLSQPNVPAQLDSPAQQTARAADSPMPPVRMPPVAKKIPTIRQFHGDSYVDNYEWLRDLEDPDVMALLNAENDWTQRCTAAQQPLRDRLVDEFKAHTQETDVSVPIYHQGFWYYSRTWEGKQYAAVFRRADTGSRPHLEPLPYQEALASVKEMLVYDGNALAEGKDFFNTSDLLISPNGKTAALGVDFSGDEHFRLRIFDVESAVILDDAVDNLGYGLVFTADSSSVFYTQVNDAWRTYQVWLHTIGEPSDADTLIFQENDERFELELSGSRDGKWAVITSRSPETTEVRLASVHAPHEDPVVVAFRRQGLDYSVEPAGDHLLIVHNGTNEDFSIAAAPLNTSTPDEWVTICEAQPGERILDVDAYADFAVVSMRRDGEPTLAVMRRRAVADQQAVVHEEVHEERKADAEPVAGQGAVADVEPREYRLWDEPMVIDTPHVADVRAIPGAEWKAQGFDFVVESTLTPKTTFSYDVASQHSMLLHTVPVPGYDPTAYIEEGVLVQAQDGAQIPMTLIRRSDVMPDGTNPGFIYGYGSYEVSNDPYFSPKLVSLLDRGVVIGWTHVRGGGERGRAWYEHGKGLEKKKTFTDFIACARWLHQSGWVGADRLAACGRSAGGLLMGAVANGAPEEFRAILAGVPFVDALTTILKPELPLTAGEWEEWGNPIESAEVYSYMKSYSPTENVQHALYPAILATTSLNDVRVSYVEPTKWVQILRSETKNDPVERPILEKVEMVAGHGGKFGRYDRWRQQSFEYAWVLWQLGITE
ncbi:MAG: S9 family peptidase [Actinomycetaceae bacterium]|nr:S9 family peptidase [Actinomycetaceae bacterium]MDY6082403.1 S9 family peptidase [Actinomycetaceae bacterium]